MFRATDSSWAPWYVVRSDDQKRARLSVISRMRKNIPCQDTRQDKVELPERQKAYGYKEPDYPYKYVPEPTWPSGWVPQVARERETRLLIKNVPIRDTALCIAHHRTSSRSRDPSVVAGGTQPPRVNKFKSLLLMISTRGRAGTWRDAKS